MLLKSSTWIIFVFDFCILKLILVTGTHRENLALRHPCLAINKRLETHIAWTKKLASSQNKVQNDACDLTAVGIACCTNEIMNTYETSLGTEFKNLLHNELSNATRLFSTSQQHINILTNEYITESQHLTVSSLEGLFGTEEYRTSINPVVLALFDTLKNIDASVDDVSKSTIDLFHHLIIAIYRKFMMNDENALLDDNLEKCLVNKAFQLEALPKQRELLYILTSGSSLMQIFYKLLIYIDADIQRLKVAAAIDSSRCIQRFARETLCPICVTASPGYNQIYNNNGDNDADTDDVGTVLCEADCRYIIRTCFNQTNDPYAVLASVAKNYSAIIKELEQIVIELKLVERLAKIHIYLYDMVVNTTNSQQMYTELQAACPNSHLKPYSPIRSVPPTLSERHEQVSQWNKSLHSLIKQIQSAVDNLNTKLTYKLVQGLCSNSNYASKSNQCTQIDKQTSLSLIQWPLPSPSPSSLNTDNGELARYQLDDLRKKIIPIQQMVTSLQPKKQISLIQYLPDFESYDVDIDINDMTDVDVPTIVEPYDFDSQESLSERLYKEIDEQTTRQPTSTTKKYFETTHENNGKAIRYNVAVYIMMVLIHRL